MAEEVSSDSVVTKEKREGEHRLSWRTKAAIAVTAAAAGLAAGQGDPQISAVAFVGIGALEAGGAIALKGAPEHIQRGLEKVRRRGREMIRGGVLAIGKKLPIIGSEISRAKALEGDRQALEAYIENLRHRQEFNSSLIDRALGVDVQVQEALYDDFVERTSAPGATNADIANAGNDTIKQFRVEVERGLLKQRIVGDVQERVEIAVDDVVMGHTTPQS